MGRHSSDRQFRFYRSVAGWFLPWALVAAVAVTAMWIAVDAIGQEDLDARPPAEPAAQQSSPSPSPKESSSPSPSPRPRSTDGQKNDSGTDARPKDKKKEPEDRSEPLPLITSGITVQVLNGTNSATAGEAMAERLMGLGFEVAAVAGATPYAETTVFWSFDDAQPAAERLASRYGWTAAPKPANLSSTVDIHVVVGADEA